MTKFEINYDYEKGEEEGFIVINVNNEYFSLDIALHIVDWDTNRVIYEIEEYFFGTCTNKEIHHSTWGDTSIIIVGGETLTFHQNTRGLIDSSFSINSIIKLNEIETVGLRERLREMIAYLKE